MALLRLPMTIAACSGAIWGLGSRLSRVQAISTRVRYQTLGESRIFVHLRPEGTIPFVGLIALRVENKSAMTWKKEAN